MRDLHLIHETLHAASCRLHACGQPRALASHAPAAGRIGQVMQRLGRNYVALFNGRHGRTGMLWEGRYKACLVDSADYVLRRYRYIELNPVRARLTVNPEAYRWSSCPANLGQRKHSALTPHPCWPALGNDPTERSNACRALLDEALPDELLASIRLHLQQQALGHDAFRAMVEAKTHRFSGVRPAHRPLKPIAVD